MLLQVPDELFKGIFGDRLPPPGDYGVGGLLPAPGRERRRELEALLDRTVEEEGQRVVGWRDVPVDKDYVGITANYFAPYIKQLVIAASQNLAGDNEAFERKLYVIRRVAEKAAGPDLVIPSLSSRTIVYKGMLTAPQLLGYYPDLQDERTHSARWRSCTRASRRTRSRAGSSRTRTDNRPQRRDQHAARQRQLDARARVAAGLRAVRRRPGEGAADRAPWRLGLGDARQRARAARARPAARCRTR